MSKSTSIVIGDHFEKFIAAQMSEGRYGSASEVIRQGLRLLEEHERRVEALRQAIIAGENSGPSTPLDMKEIILKARKRARLDA